MLQRDRLKGIKAGAALMGNEIADLNKKFSNIIFGVPETVEIKKDKPQKENGSDDKVKGFLTEALEHVKEGNHPEAKKALKKAKRSTKCDACHKMIDRTLMDLDYVKNLCVSGEDDCDDGLENVEKGIVSIRDDYLGDSK